MLTVEVDGYRFPAKYIGKGHYSKVYQVGNRVIYYTRGDCAKEVMAMFLYDRITHLPEMIQHDDVFGYRGRRWYVFSSPYYRNITKKDCSAYELMKEIMVLYYQFNSEVVGTGVKGLDKMVMLEDYMRGSVPRSVSRALQAIVNIVSNCDQTDIGFDFHKKNFGVNDYGTLIFRDPFYVYSGG